MSSGIATADNYHRYVFSKVSPFLRGKVWEIGSGYGQYTRYLLESGRTVLATDVDNELLDCMRQSELKGLIGSRLAIKRLDLYSAEEITDCGRWEPDSIVCLNVLEHISDDTACIARINGAVPRGTTAVFLCPAHQSLYGFMDSEAGHYRRYTRGSLEGPFKKSGWIIKTSFYINPIGAIGWFVRNKIAPPQSTSLDDPRVNADIAIFDKYILPFSKMLDPLTRSLFGQSAIVVAEKL